MSNIGDLIPNNGDNTSSSPPSVKQLISRADKKEEEICKECFEQTKNEGFAFVKTEFELLISTFPESKRLIGENVQEWRRAFDNTLGICRPLKYYLLYSSPLTEEINPLFNLLAKQFIAKTINKEKIGRKINLEYLEDSNDVRFAYQSLIDEISKTDIKVRTYDAYNLITMAKSKGSLASPFNPNLFIQKLNVVVRDFRTLESSEKDIYFEEMFARLYLEAQYRGNRLVNWVSKTVSKRMTLENLLIFLKELEREKSLKEALIFRESTGIYRENNTYVGKMLEIKKNKIGKSTRSFKSKLCHFCLRTGHYKEKCRFFQIYQEEPDMFEKANREVEGKNYRFWRLKPEFRRLSRDMVVNTQSYLKNKKIIHSINSINHSVEISSHYS